MTKPPAVLNKSMALAPKLNKNADKEITLAPAIQVLMTKFRLTEEAARHMVGLPHLSKS
jgi:hypothetical protein